MQFKKLSDILEKAKNRYPAFGQRWTEAEAVSRWEKAVGPIIAKNSQAVCVKNGILWVEVTHSIWRAELHFRKNQILEILNGQAESAEGVIRDIFFLDRRQTARPAPGVFNKTKSP